MEGRRNEFARRTFDPASVDRNVRKCQNKVGFGTESIDSRTTKYSRFEDLPVWQNALELVERVYRLTRSRLFSQSGDLRDQLRRAALSVSNNVAEGFERGTTSELLMFLYIARGSAGEVRSMLRLCERLLAERRPPSDDSHQSLRDSEISNLKSEISNPRSEVAALVELAESWSRQLRGWADSLQNSEIKGQRHLNDKTRGEYEQKRRADAFRRLIEQNFRDAHPELFAAREPEASA